MPEIGEANMVFPQDRDSFCDLRIGGGLRSLRLLPLSHSVGPLGRPIPVPHRDGRSFYRRHNTGQASFPTDT